MRFPSRLKAIAGSLLLTGCFSVGGDEGCNVTDYSGLAGKADFVYECRSQEGDAWCRESASSWFGVNRPTLPARIARGTSFRIVSSDRIVEPVSSTLVPRDGGWFVGNTEGFVGFVAREGNAVVDATRVFLVAPTSIAIRRVDPDGWMGGSTSRTRYALDVMGDAWSLAGTPDVVWSVDDPTLVSLDPSAFGTVTVTTQGVAGTTTLNARALGYEAHFRLTTTAAPEEPDAGDAGDAGAEADGGDAGDAGVDGGDQ